MNRILLSAFACQPGGGSERGEGWAWTLELAGTCDLTVLTDEGMRRFIEPEIAERPLENVTFVYIGTGFGDVTSRLKRWGYYRAWQKQALERAQELHEAEPFDLVHHVTFGTHRVPSELWRLGAPFVFGPVGGGESVPWRFYDPRHLGWRQAGREAMREASNLLARVDPRLRAMAEHAAVLGVSTQQTADAFPGDVSDKARIVHKSLIPREALLQMAERTPTPPDGSGLRVLFAGRLLGWKGVPYALQAFARHAEQDPGAHFDLYGQGAMQDELVAMAADLGITDRVTFHGRVPREDLLAAYADNHVFLFPSLHDSSGFVVQEAMAAALPVVCLDTGGPGLMVPDGAGVKVAPTTPDEVVEGLAAGLAALSDPERWAAASAAARDHVLDPATHQDIADVRRILHGAAGIDG